MRKIYTVLYILAISTSCFANSYRISNVGKAFIQDKEKCELTAYWDSNGYSIGYGHHAKDVKKGQRISHAQAIKFFNEDIKTVEASVNRILSSLPYKYKFSQSFIDGLCSFVYNAGEGGVKNSEFYKRLKKCRVKNGVMNKNDYEFTIAAVKNSRISCKGHVSRRYDEHMLMLKNS